MLVYALMPNHVHLLIEDPEARLSRFMQILNARYTRYFNFRHQRVGHLYQGRFHARLVDRDAYLLEVSRYIHLNPVRAGLVERPESYSWSSYHHYIAPSVELQPRLVETELVLSLFSGGTSTRFASYQAFVEAMTLPQWSDWESRLRRLKLLGSARFASQVSDTFPVPKSV